MAKNLQLKSCGTDKPRDSFLSFRYIVVLGLLLSSGLDVLAVLEEIGTTGSIQANY